MWTKKTTSEKWKFNSNKKLGLEWAVNALGKPFRKKSDPKIEKTVKIRVKLPHANKKPLPRNRTFVQSQFSHSTLKLEREKFTPQNHSLFRSTSCFGVTKITTPIWLQESWKCVNRSFKKKTVPQYNSNSLNCKKGEHLNNSRKIWKNCKVCQKMLKFMTAKSWKPFHCH